LQIDGFSDILVTPKIIDNQFSYQVTAIRQ
jgi:hypothetical protein